MYSRTIAYEITSYIKGKFGDVIQFADEGKIGIITFTQSVTYGELGAESFWMRIFVMEYFADIIGVLVSKIEEEKRSAVAEYLHRVNYGLPYGNFEFDVSDGEVRFKNSMCCAGGIAPTEGMLQDFLETTSWCMYRYKRPLLKLLAGELTPEEAAIEGDTRKL